MKPMKELGFDEAFLARQRKLALQDAKELRERILKMKAKKGSAVGAARKKKTSNTQSDSVRKPTKKN